MSNSEAREVRKPPVLAATIAKSGKSDLIGRQLADRSSPPLRPSGTEREISLRFQ